jgi:hypothetical protein
LSVVWHATGQTEKLWHKVRYSADGGTTWLGVVRRSAKPAVTLNLARLPGGENGLVEVYSTDGVRTARLRSKRFQVPHRPPTAVIGAVSQPAGAQRGWVRALGAGFDEAGRALSKDALRWHSNKDGDLGTGDTLETRLSAGEHKIALVASDKAGRQARSEISVRISGRA